MNQVETYLKAHKLSVAALARLCGTSRQRIQYNLNHNVKYWQGNLALLLEKGTGGEIKASKLILGK